MWFVLRRPAFTVDGWEFWKAFEDEDDAQDSFDASTTFYEHNIIFLPAQKVS